MTMVKDDNRNNTQLNRLSRDSHPVVTCRGIEPCFEFIKGCRVSHKKESPATIFLHQVLNDLFKYNYKTIIWFYGDCFILRGACSIIAGNYFPIVIVKQDA